ncbi:MAG: phage holin family protein [marine benthic group bacterium]|nr:phage holin family protein [Candidatus Benthicola marisminoris]
MKLILRWLINAAALYVAVRIVPGIEATDTNAILIAAVVIGLINATLKPLAVLLTLPLTVLTLGLFYLVVNGAMLYLTAALTPGFQLAGFGSAVLGAIVISIVGMLLGGLVGDED